MPDERPNVVFVIADDHRYDVLGCRGDPHVETPSIDRLAAEGCLFENAFTATALCAPSRASFLTGKYAHRAGAPRMPRTNNTFRRTQRPFPARLHDAGYHAAHVGKWHLGDGDEPADGYDYWAAFDWLGEFFDPTVHVDGEAREFEGYADDVLSELAADHVRDVAADEAPFCLTLGLKAPHLHFDYPERYADALADADIPPPETVDEDRAAAGKDPLADAVIDLEEFAGGLPLFDDYDDYVRSYYRAVMALDDAVGRVREALDDADVLDETVFVYTSDHGYSHGEHGLTEKHFAYEDSMRIPMVVRYPPLTGPGGRRPTEMVLNTDVAPTLHDLCGVPSDEEMDGRSLRPLLDPDADAEDWREEFLFAFEGNDDGLPSQLAVRTRDHKLIDYQYHDHRELYGLGADPDETENLVDDPAYADVRAELTERLDRLRAETGYAVRTEQPVRNCHVLGPVPESAAPEVRSRLGEDGLSFDRTVAVGDATVAWRPVAGRDGGLDVGDGLASQGSGVAYVALTVDRTIDYDPLTEVSVAPAPDGAAYVRGERVAEFDGDGGAASFNPPLVEERTVALLGLAAAELETLSVTVTAPAGSVEVGR